MASVKLELSDVEVAMLAACIDVRQAQIKRSFNNTSDGDLKAVYQKQAVALADLSRKFVKGV